MQVREVAKKAGVPAHVVRYYTKLNLLKPGRDPNNRYRDYSESDVRRVKFIRRAKRLGFTLADARAILHDADKGESACPKARALIEQRLAEHGERIQALMALHRRMTEAIEVWKTLPDDTPDGHSLCHLIERVTDTDEEHIDSLADINQLFDMGHRQWTG